MHERVTEDRRPGIGRHLAVHASLLLFLVGEAYGVNAQLKRLNFGGPPTHRNIEGRVDLVRIGLVFVVLAVIVALIGGDLWIAGILLLHALLILFADGWSYTAVPAAVALIVLWIAWTRRAIRHPQADDG